MVVRLLGLLALLFPVFVASDDEKDVPPLSPVPSKDQTSYKYYMTPDTLQAAAGPYLKKIESVAMSTKIEDYENVLNTSVGKIDIAITNIVLQMFDMGTLQTSMDLSTNGISGWLDDNKLELIFDYSYQQLSFPYKSETGIGKVYTYNMRVDLDITATKAEETGGAIVKINTFNVDVGDFTIEMEGGLAASIISTLETLFSDMINDFLSNVFTEYLETIVEPVLDKAGENPPYNCLGEHLCWEYRFTQDPVTVSSGFFLIFSGIAYDPDHQDLMPALEYTELPNIATSSLLTIQFGNASFQSILNVLQVENLFSFQNPTTGLVEPTVMSYDDIVSYYPAWANAYPSGTSGQYSITVSDFPKSYIMYNGLKIDINASVSLVPVGQTDTTNIASKASFTFLGEVFFKDYHNNKNTIIEKNRDVLTIQTSFVSVSLEDASVSKEWLTNIVSEDYLKQINTAFDKNPFGIFDISGLRYINAQVAYNGEYALLTTDFYIEDN